MPRKRLWRFGAPNKGFRGSRPLNNWEAVDHSHSHLWVTIPAISGYGLWLKVVHGSLYFQFTYHPRETHGPKRWCLNPPTKMGRGGGGGGETKDQSLACLDPSLALTQQLSTRHRSMELAFVGYLLEREAKKTHSMFQGPNSKRIGDVAVFGEGTPLHWLVFKGTISGPRMNRYKPGAPPARCPTRRKRPGTSRPGRGADSAPRLGRSTACGLAKQKGCLWNESRWFPFGAPYKQPTYWVPHPKLRN